MSAISDAAELIVCEKKDWYANLKNEGQYVFDLISKYHKYFSAQDKKYRFIVRTVKVIILIFAMLSTVVLGLKTIISTDAQIVIGLILSALITFITAVSSYFNFEEYWMRNITIHIKLNVLRDNFIFEAEAGKLDNTRTDYYRIELDKIQHENIRYWEKSIKKI
jgi:hypothetical protein